MTRAVTRMREAADWMRLEPAPMYTQVAAWLTRVAADAARRQPWQTPAQHATYLATGERANATATADAYLTVIHAPQDAP
jgi:hypothetical protein